MASTAVAVVTFVASFFLMGEDALPGSFYVQRQAFWNGGTYGVKFTWLLTWFTLLAAAALPFVLVLGVAVLVRRWVESPTDVPAGWDVRQTGRRLLLATAALGVLVVWASVAAVVVLEPDSLSPLGGFASISLLVLPALPLVPALLFEALIPPRYVEGPIEGMQFTSYKDRTTLHLHVAGRHYTMSPSVTEGLGLGQGTRVGLVATGFFKSVRRIARIA